MKKIEHKVGDYTVTIVLDEDRVALTAEGLFGLIVEPVEGKYIGVTASDQFRFAADRIICEGEESRQRSDFHDTSWVLERDDDWDDEDWDGEDWDDEE